MAKVKIGIELDEVMEYFIGSPHPDIEAEVDEEDADRWIRVIKAYREVQNEIRAAYSEADSQRGAAKWTEDTRFR